jgi:hypothetical protein
MVWYDFSSVSTRLVVDNVCGGAAAWRQPGAAVSSSGARWQRAAAWLPKAPHLLAPPGFLASLATATVFQGFSRGHGSLPPSRASHLASLSAPSLRGSVTVSFQKKDADDYTRRGLLASAAKPSHAPQAACTATGSTSQLPSRRFLHSAPLFRPDNLKIMGCQILFHVNLGPPLPPAFVIQRWG